MPLIRAVRVFIHWLRALCRAEIVCWSSLRIETGWMRGLRAASSSPSQSVRSVLFRGT